MDRILVAVLVALSGLAASAAPPRQMTWDELASIAGKEVRIAMPDGAVISGRAAAVEPDALVVRLRRQPDFRVPRASLKALEVREKSKHYRVIGTVVGAVAGLAGGTAAAFAISPLLSRHNQGRAAAAFIGITAAGTAAGYALGNAADRKTTTIVVQP